MFRVVGFQGLGLSGLIQVLVFRVLGCRISDFNVFGGLGCRSLGFRALWF